MRALVIGFGSIGARHARVLEELGCEVSVVSRRSGLERPTLSTLDAGLAQHPEYIVVANKTSEHHDTLNAVARSGFRGRVLVEKPLFHLPLPMPPNEFSGLFVGYQLRFHPVLARLRAAIAGERVLSVQCYAGQHLEGWRPGRDYSESYSASAVEGGGVLRDLSHELDYLSWLFGKWTRIAAIGGHLSTLRVESDDTYTALMAMERCSALTLQLNYLDRTSRRSIIVNTDSHTFEADLVGSTFRTDKDVEKIEVSRDEVFAAQHRAVLAGDDGTLCSAEDAEEVVEMVAAIELADREQRWVVRSAK